MIKSPTQAILLLAVTVATLAATTVAAQEAPAEEVERAILKLSAVRELDALSREIWPGWKISDTAFALYEEGEGRCFLVNHPDPPAGFERERTSDRSRATFHVARTDGLTPETGPMGGTVTAYLTWDCLETEALPSAFEQAFRAHLMDECPDLVRSRPLLDGYPLTPENLALSEIECELLARASLAPDDSLARWTREFVAVRAYRRLRLSSPAAEAYESRLERLEGLSAYIGERARGEATRHLRGRSAELLAGNLGPPVDPRVCIRQPGGLDWYRKDRYRATGAVLCELLDRFHPAWREEAERCPDPYLALWELTRTDLPRAFQVLPKYDFRSRMDERISYVEGLKSDAERFFDRIVGGDGRKLVVNTRLLASSSVSYDPENIERVDENRVVHKRIIKIEFSGGTRVHIVGVPAAANIGDDEFDIEQVTIEAPERYDVTVGGEPIELTPGVHQFEEPLSVSAQGLLIEARAGVIMVADEKVTFMLHR